MVRKIDIGLLGLKKLFNKKHTLKISIESSSLKQILMTLMLKDYRTIKFLTKKEIYTLKF